MKKILTYLLIFSIAMFVSSYINAADGGTKKVIKLSHSHQETTNSEIHTAALAFQDYVNSHSKTMEVKIYANNTLGEERVVYEQIQLGSGATCVISGTAIINSFNKRVGVLDLPFIWKDYSQIHKVLDGDVGNILAKELENSGFKVIAWMDSWGYRNIVTAKKNVKTVNDLKGLKIRTIQSPVYIATINGMGCNATPMPFGEVYTAMQTGVLDGFEHGATTVVSGKYYEVAKYIALTRHLFGPLAFVYSKKEFDKLSNDEKEIILKAAQVARDKQRDLAPTKEKEAFEFLKSKGMIINDIDMSPLKPTMTKIQKDTAANLGANDLLNEILSVK